MARSSITCATTFWTRTIGLLTLTRQRKPAERQNDFGGVFSGPIIRNRTFFFFSYEGLRLRQPLVTTGTEIPSNSLRQSANAQVRPYLAAYPIPNGVDLGNGLAQFSASYSNPSTLDATSEANGNDALTLTNLDNPSAIAVAPRGTPLYKTTYNNVAPRIGISYQLSQRPGREMVLRGGFGVFYDLGNAQAASGFLGSPFSHP